MDELHTYLESIMDEVKEMNDNEYWLFDRICSVYSSNNQAAKRIMHNLLRKYPSHFQIIQALDKAEAVIKLGIDYV